MNIAHIAPAWFPIPPENYGGTEYVIHHLVSEQVQQGHDVTLFAPADANTSARLVSFFPQSLIPSGVPWAAHLKAYYHLHKSVEYIQSHPFDIVHTHLSSSSDMYIFPLMAHLDVPHIMTLHSHFPFDRVDNWTGDADELYMEEWASSVPIVTISENEREMVPASLHVIGAVHHGIPLDQYVPTTTQPDDFFVWLGRIVPEKGPHLAIEAAKRAGVRLVIAGIVDEYTSEAKEYFEQTIQPQIDDKQITYYGPADMQQKIDLFSRARALLNPITWEEPFGMVMLEAMALGCPVISFARGAAPELVQQKETGFLVEDTDAMVEAIPQVAQLDRERIRTYVARHFSTRIMAENYELLYEKVIAAFAQKQPSISSLTGVS